MRHQSIIKPGSPIEFITTEAISPFISKCLIKVCYVGDEPNRNRSIITKDTARKMASSLRGCPIVGFYNETKDDFEQHHRMIQQIGLSFCLCYFHGISVPHSVDEIPHTMDYKFKLITVFQGTACREAGCPLYIE